MAIKEVIKRDKRVEDFDPSKLEKAIFNCLKSINGGRVRDHLKKSEELAEAVLNSESLAEKEVLTVEEIQDAVEQTLMQKELFSEAKAYILYREKHKALRDTRPISPEVKAIVNSNKVYFSSPIQEFQFYDKYDP